jgi:hypothetical protein
VLLAQAAPAGVLVVQVDGVVPLEQVVALAAAVVSAAAVSVVGAARVKTGFFIAWCFFAR